MDIFPPQLRRSAVTGCLIVSQPLVDKPLYDRWVLRAGSWALLGLSAFWFVQRVL